MRGGTIPMPFHGLPGYWKDLVEGLMQLIDSHRCENANVPYVAEDFRPGMCGWRCSFMGETNCIPRCTMLYTCCSVYKCVRPKWKANVGLYEALRQCQHDDCRVQMWGCKKVKQDQDPRGHDENWDPYDVLDTGKHGMNRAAANFGPDPRQAFRTAGKMPDFKERLLPFWNWPYTFDGEVFGGKGLQDQNLFPYNIYRMLGGMPFERIDIK